MTPIAITGATGAVGGRVLRTLLDNGEPVRVVVRDPSRVPVGAAIDLAVAAYDQPERLRAAFAGVSTVLFVSGGEAADRLDQHRNVVEACSASGVEHLVYTSFLGAAPDATFTFARDHFHTEEAVRQAGLGFTFLRNSLYIDVLPYLPGEDGVIRGPAGHGRFAPVARDDVAGVASAVLLAPERHAGQTYELTGPALTDLYEVAAELSRASGRRISYQPETLDEAYASRAPYGAPAWEVEGWVTSYAAIGAGELSTCCADVRRVTGREAISARQWFEEHAESYRHLGGD